MIPALALLHLLEFDKYTQPLSQDIPFISAEECRSCHQQETEEWESSRHAQAWSNPLFQEGYIAEPDPVCIFCHAPHQAQLDEIKQNATWYAALHPSTGSLYNIPEKKPEPAANEGITCATCHLHRGWVRSSEANPQAAHPTFADPLLKSSEFCKDCHDFPIIERQNGRPFISDTPMQTTYQEWKEWSEQGGAQTCQGCHMPQGSHTMHGANDRELLKSSIQVELTRRDDFVLFSVQSVGVGHNLPSGDLFRNITAEIKIQDTWVVLAKWGRAFDEFVEPSGLHKRLVSDTAIRPNVPVHFSTNISIGTPWRVRYHYGSPRDELRGFLPIDDLIVTLKEGSAP